MRRPHRILIAGAGIAGLSLAAQLRTSSHRCEVVEKAETARPDGSGLTISFNGARALQRLGCLSEVEKQGRVIDRVVIANRTGERLDVLDLRAAQQRFGLTFAISRPLFHRALEAKADAPVRYSKAFVALREVADRVEVTFSDAAVEVFDLVVGADGAYSRVRACAFPGASFRANGVYCWRFIAHDGRDARDVTEFLGDGRRVGLIPLRGRETYVFATCDAGVLARTQGTPRQRLRRLFSDFAAPIPDLINGPLSAFSFQALGGLPRFHLARGRIALIGDAAHAMTPNLAQGASLAMEDAVELAAVLAARPVTPHALQRYARARLARLKRMALAADFAGRVAHVRHPVLRAMRDTCLGSSMITNRLVHALLAWGMLDGQSSRTALRSAPNR
jgi:2-polyprenyl-6-methoxyphenol hydroxylase-like FAD-dependent oxidoreductase